MIPTIFPFLVYYLISPILFIFKPLRTTINYSTPFNQSDYSIPIPTHLSIYFPSLKCLYDPIAAPYHIPIIAYIPISMFHTLRSISTTIIFFTHIKTFITEYFTGN